MTILFLQPHLHTVERHGLGAGKLHVELGHPRQATQPGDKALDPRRRSSNRAVHALARQQQRAAQILFDTKPAQRLAQRCGILEAGETVKGGDGDHSGQLRPAGRHDKGLTPRGRALAAPLLLRGRLTAQSRQA